MKIGIIGGGASGFFAAINCKLFDNEAQVVVFEKTGKLLSKVMVSGGGRCNVTNAEENIVRFSKNYPRGEKKFKDMLKMFSQTDMVLWLNKQGVRLKSEPDGRVFPVSDSSQTIVDCFLKLANEKGIEIRTQSNVTKIDKNESGFSIYFNGNTEDFDHVIVAMGGNSKAENYKIISDLGHKIIPPVPSLFTFNFPNWQLAELMGVSVSQTKVSLIDYKFEQTGPLLITHWGLSGPAIIKLSAWGAKHLHDCAYQFKVKVNWLGGTSESEVYQALENCKEQHAKSKILNTNPFPLTNRLWGKFLELSEIGDERWLDVSKKQQNKLVQCLINSQFEAKGKTTFKEEFVTAGGVDLAEIDCETMESKLAKGVYFCGEVLNIDGVTGGFNFQNAWTTAYVAAKSATCKP